MKSFTQLDILSDSAHICRPIAQIKFTPQQLSESHSIIFTQHRDDLDNFIAALIISPSKRKFGLIYYLNTPEPRFTDIWIDERADDLTGALTDLKESLEIKEDDLHWIHPDIHEKRQAEQGAAANP